MNKVYIPNRGVHNYKPAESFGELVYLSEGAVNRFNVGRMARRFIEKMADSTEKDWIVMGGLQQLCALAVGIQVQKFGCLNLLIYDAKKGRYTPREINFEIIKEIDNESING